MSGVARVRSSFVSRKRCEKILHFLVIAGLALGVQMVSVNRVSAMPKCTDPLSPFIEGQWTCGLIDDGFSRSLFVNTASSLKDGRRLYLVVGCADTEEGKKFSILVSGYEGIMTWDNSRNTVQMRVDKGPIRVYKVRNYVTDDGDAMFSMSNHSGGLSIPVLRGITTSMLKARNSISFKFREVAGFTVVNFPAGNFSKFEKAFKSEGCPLR